LARRKLESGADISRFLDNIVQAAERGATLTHRMLAFARKQDLELTPVELPDLVRGMADLLQRTIGPGVAIETRFPLSLRPVRADAAQLELALINLAVNARDAMPDGGAIVIGARQARARAADGLEPGDYVCLSVTDEGEGMDAETLASASEPFFTTKGVGRGTGLGLPMVAGMAEQCGGQLRLRSVKGEGTTAEIWLPVAAPGHTAPSAAAPATSATPTIAPLTVLAVDDDELVLTNTCALLAEMGHSVLHARSGPSALALLRAQPVDLLLTDFAMPGMTGAELAAIANRDWPGMRILMVSGYADMPEGSAVGVPRLAKPFRPQQLAGAVYQTMQTVSSGTGDAPASVPSPSRLRANWDAEPLAST
ncbi:MAG: sensor histidine kinase, partial [Brevundimonas sp.]|nr:sensor histidine kinase [Brevundimonas sp.]